MNEKPNATTLSPIMVLNDGETFSSLTGCSVAFADPELTTEDIEEQLDDGRLTKFRVGPHAEAPKTADEAIEMMLALCPWLTAEFDNDGQLVFKSGLSK